MVEPMDSSTPLQENAGPLHDTYDDTLGLDFAKPQLI